MKTTLRWILVRWDDFLVYCAGVQPDIAADDDVTILHYQIPFSHTYISLNSVPHSRITLYNVERVGNFTVLKSATFSCLYNPERFHITSDLILHVTTVHSQLH